ncbi:MAG TPA: hypothetical protein V6D19_13990 [Stenomitos sp.]
MLKSLSTLAMVTLTVGTSFAIPSFVSAEEITCTGTLGAITVDNVKVPQGRSCTLNGTTVKGNVVVNTGAILKAVGAKVNGSIQAEGAAFVDVNSNSVVGGNVQIVQGRRARVVSTRINADLLYDSNSGALVANNNTIGGNLQAFQNTGGVTIRRNRINGNLQCKENNPAPIGGGNIVNGSKEDQCARL